MKIDTYIEKNFNYSDSDRPIIILGSTSGIGKEATFIFAKLHYRLVLANRNRNKSNLFKQEILKLYPSANIELLDYDQSSYQSIDNLINEIKTKYNNFYSLIINAGVFHENKNLYCYNKIPLVMMTNFIGPTYLINKLDEIHSLLTNEEHKVVFVGSLSKTFVKYKNNLIDGNYSLSKLCLYNLFYHSYINNKDNMKYLMMEPGVSMTNIIRNLPKVIRVLANIIMPIFSNSPKKGSLGILEATLKINNNGDIYIPKHFFHFKGYPKLSKLNKKIIDNNIIDCAYKLIEETNH
ncbi:MAG: SDR family NAD(P)-dependent oxidoreductase [Bacilli bacterium]